MAIAQFVSNRLKVGAAALLAAGLLATSIAPASAGMWAQSDQTAAASRHHGSSFHHHFYRGVPRSNAAWADGSMQAMSDGGREMEDATSYCMERFKSYDPSTGTYLGYDGHEHPCP